MIEGFIPDDRRRALVQGTDLAPVVNGTVLFCDITGYSALSASYLREHGRRFAAERMHRLLEDLIGDVVRTARARQGIAVSFAGDAVTLWFDAADVGSDVAAAAQGAATAMEIHRGRAGQSPGLRISLASGRFDRLRMGDPYFGWLELLGGGTVRTLAEVDQLASADRVVVCRQTAVLLTKAKAQLISIAGRDAMQLNDILCPPVANGIALPRVAADAAIAWIPLRLRDAVLMLENASQTGPVDLSSLAEIRPVTAMFVLIPGLGADEDRLRAARATAFLSNLQDSVHRAGGMVLDLNADEKGNYATCIFGAPAAHEDDPERALSAALTVLQSGRDCDVILKIGVARGTCLTGLIAADKRLRYGVNGDVMSKAARLMMRAEPGSALITSDLAEGALAMFEIAEIGLGQDGVPGREIPAWRLGNRLQPVASATAPRRRHGPLVERDAVLAELEQLVASDAGGLVVVESAPGFGKSALFDALRQTPGKHDHLWLEGRAESQSRKVSFHAWFPVFRGILNQMDMTTSDDARILEWVVGISTSMPEPLAGLSGSERAVKIGKSLLAILTALNDLRPVTIIVDDLQWADTRSVGLFLTLVSSGLPIRILAARRAGPPASMELAMLLSHPRARTLSLGPLTQSGVSALAASLLGAKTLAYDLEQLLEQSAGGSPLFVTQIAEVLARRALVGVRDGHCTVTADAAHLGRLDFLESLEAAILARFDAISDNLKQPLRTASLLGRSFTMQALEAALPDLENPKAMVSALIGSGYVEPDFAGSPNAFRFVQPLVQQILAESLSFARREEIHRRLAGFWSPRGDAGALQQRARHLLGAIGAEEKDPSRLHEAISALEAAAQQAATNDANLEASDLLDAALSLSWRLPASPEADWLRLHLQAGLAFAMATFRGYGDPSVEASYRAALALADGSENSADLAFTIYGLFSFYASRGDYSEAMPIARRLHRLAMMFSDLRLASIAHQSRAIIATLRGRAATGARLAALSINDADKIGHGRFFPHGGAGDFRIFSSAWLVLCLAVMGRRDEAQAARAKAVDLALTNNFARGFLNCFAPLPVLAGSPTEALAYADAIVADAETSGFALFGVIGGVYAGWAAARLGLDDARVAGFLNAKIHVARAMGLGSFTPWFSCLAAEAHLARSETEAAASAVASAEQTLAQSGGGLFAAPVARCRALISHASGDYSNAAQSLDRAVALAAGRGLVIFAQEAAYTARTLLPAMATLDEE